MARPTVRKLEDGRAISFQGFSKEDVERIVAYAQSMQPEVIREEQIFEPSDDHQVGDLPYQAVGGFRDASGWNVVTIGYNPETKASEMESIRPTPDFRMTLVEINRVLDENGLF